jgi:hypothetical protein
MEPPESSALWQISPLSKLGALFFLNRPCEQQRDHCAERKMLIRCHHPQRIGELAGHNCAHRNAGFPLIFCRTPEGRINECHHIQASRCATSRHPS